MTVVVALRHACSVLYVKVITTIGGFAFVLEPKNRTRARETALALHPTTEAS